MVPREALSWLSWVFDVPVLLKVTGGLYLNCIHFASYLLVNVMLVLYPM